MKRDNDFWDTCAPGTLRNAAALFIDGLPILCDLQNEKYFELEDALVSFAEQHKTDIWRTVEKENRRGGVQ